MTTAFMPPPAMSHGRTDYTHEGNAPSGYGGMSSAPSNSTAYAMSPPASMQNLSISRQDDFQSNGSGSSSSSFAQQQQPRLRRQRPDTEEIRRVGRVHYQELLEFLRSHLLKEQTGPRSNAREKLTRLSKQQFTELSTDVYDELMRRINNARQQTNMPHLAVREEFHPKRNQARQKLATLPKTRFKDLSSDVFFELERRFPELKEEFRPEAIARERELAEQEAEQQRQAAAAASAASAQRQGSSSSNDKQPVQPPQESLTDRIVPTKSRLVQEDIQVPYENDKRDSLNDGGQSTRDSMDLPDNRSTMYSQASSVGTGFFSGYGTHRGADSIASPGLGRNSTTNDGPNTFGIEKLRSDYEFRIATLQQKVNALEAENAELSAVKTSGRQEREQLEATHAQRIGSIEEELSLLRQQHDAKHQELESTSQRLGQMQRDFDAKASAGSLQQDIDQLRTELDEQEQLIQDLRSEVESLVQEIEQLSNRNEELVAEKDQDLTVIKDLSYQVQSYKRKYEQAKTELRQYKATSQLYVQQPKADDFMPPSESGVIADVNVTAFQSSIDELLATARSTTPSNVLVSMKSVVLATTLVTDDVAKFEQSGTAQLSPDESEQLDQLKPKISTSLNNLITACRNHASSQGMSPVSLLDAAASHVSTTIVDLVKLLKVRSATPAEKENFEAHFARDILPPGGLKPLHIGSYNGPGALTSPRSIGGNNLSPMPDSAEFKSRALGERLQASDNTTNGLSPRTIKTGMPSNGSSGRYSPVGYRPNVGRVGSGHGTAADVSWSQQSGGPTTSRSRATSSSSASSTNGGPNTSIDVPALPRTDLSSVKSSWVSPPRRQDTNSVASSSRQVSASFEPSNASILKPRLSNLADNSPAAIGLDGDDNSEENWAELRNYIEVQTEAIVHSIQALLSAIREGAQANQLNENLEAITTIASSIVAISRENLPPNGKDQGEAILDELTENCEKLSEMQAATTFDKGTKTAMAGASYGVAKGLKALNALLR